MKTQIKINNLAVAEKVELGQIYKHIDGDTLYITSMVGGNYYLINVGSGFPYSNADCKIIEEVFGRFRNKFVLVKELIANFS